MATAAKTGEPLALSPARRRAWGRLSAGHLVMIAAGLVGMVLTLAALRDRPAGREVAVAAHDIHAGDALVPTDLRLVRVDADDDVLATVVRGRDLGHVRGLVATARIGAGELVPRRGLRPQAAPGGLRAMSIPIDPARAVGGRLAAGDRVDVVFAGREESSIIVADALVLSVDARGRGGIGESASPFTVTVAVDARQSELLAAAIADGNLSLTRTTGAEPSVGTPAIPLDRSGSPDAAGS